MKKVLKVLAIIILTILILVGVLIWGIQTPAGQNFLTAQANTYLRKKLKTKVNIDQIRFDIPDWVVLEGVFVADTKGDTLLAGKKLRVDLDMYSLIQGNIGINKVELSGIRANIYRTLPDTVFNFQFIVDAFASGEPAVEDTTSAPLEMRLDNVYLKDVRLSYRDAVTGTDAESIIDTAAVHFEKFNPTLSQYHPTKLFLVNSSAKVRLYEALKKDTPSNPADPADSLDLKAGDLDIRKFRWTFVDENSGLQNGVSVDKLSGHVNQLYMGSQRVDVRNVLLENMSAYASFEKRPTPEVKEQTDSAATEEPGWNVKVGEILLVNNRLQYDDFNSPKQPKGLDYAHLDISSLNIKLKDFLFSSENIAGQLLSGSLRDKSGFGIQELRTDFAYGARETYLKKLLLKTGKTTLQDELILKYKDIDQLAEDIANVQVKLRLTNSQVGFADLLLLVPDLAKTPPFDKTPNGFLKGSGIVTGSVNNLLISKANFSMLNTTALKMDGRISGLPDAGKLAMDLNISELTSGKDDILMLLPDSTLPSSVEIPEKISISGKIRGVMSNLNLNTTINTSFGVGTFSGNLKNISDSLKAEYDGNLSFTEFDLGKLLKQPPQEMGKLTLSTTVSGRGYASKTMQANLDGTIQRADIKGYIYNNLTLKGSVDKGLANVQATMADENIKVAIDGEADLSKQYPSVKGEVKIDELNLTALHLYPDSLQVKGDVKIDFQSTQPDAPLGSIAIHDLVLTHHGRPVAVDSIQAVVSDSSGTKRAAINSPFLKAELTGNFVYPELADAILTEVGKHFKSPGLAYKEVTKPVNFDFAATLTNHPALRIFVPQLQELNPVNFKARLDNQQDSTIVARLSLPVAVYDSIRTERVAVSFVTVAEKAAFNSTMGLLNTGGFRMQNVSLQGDMIDNDIRFDLTVRDSVNTDRHAVKGDLAIDRSKYKLSLREGLLLDYKKWETNPEGLIEYSTDSLLVKNIEIRNEYQKLRINSTTGVPNGPLEITMDSIAVGPMVALATRDSTLASGTLGGKITLINYMTTPLYTGEFHINNLAAMQIPVGNLALKSTNETENKILVETTLKGNGNDISINGYYSPKEKNPLDFTMDLKQLSAKTVEAFSFGQLKRATGNLTGKATITGSTDIPKINGAINFDDVAFNVTQLGARYSLANQKIQFDGQQINFNNFVVSDTLNQKLTVDGNVNIARIPDVTYDLKIAAKNFTVLNSTQKENNQFYGKAVIDANMTVKGAGTKSVIDGNVKVDAGSDVTVVLTNDATEAGDATKGVIEFVDMSDSTQVTRADSIDLNTGPVGNFAQQISMELAVDDKSQFRVVIDELNGDNIKLKGNAELTAGIAPNGQLFLLGAYDLTEGSYDITLEILKRQFQIQKGSNLIWTGDPMKAELNITASYPVMVDPGSISNTLKSGRKVPIDVQIVITGNLSNPNIAFKITPSSTVTSDLAKEITTQPFWTNMEMSPSEVNKQAFALLITNRFITDQSASSFNINNSAEAIARQSVSQLLSDQLNNLASDLVKGVNLDLNLNSTTDQSAGARTDLSVGLSKAFLNDRLKISIGKNFELENQSGAAGSSEVFDNIALDYAVSRDGRYLFRAYRKNQYQSILEGFIVETGVSFIITADYNVFREFFQKQQNEK
ncbi:hypothetical protein DYBT9275_00375 [Dyadobacter sp. CECT 9275]|uniref:Translocation and assembly module TamB C-terminal domain-containing protein n=1 Tax=Dyadobacter helix TaxID=2822344 RepID=A0A916J8G0_9BACT|nr:translocation/assembly module TamB domain-containing protein [Dyadobacter sp. CECT 9275]CAG4989771.1 hypothetical protein DYBT9275_00375 [Dyadobacter sp. CECT 9275]